MKKAVCGGDLDMESGQLESPNFPEDYQLNKECIWRIRSVQPLISEFIQNISPPLSWLILQTKFMNNKIQSDIEVYTSPEYPRTFK